jgi:transcriptional regulator with XRE-family HTH domain
MGNDIDTHLGKRLRRRRRLLGLTQQQLAGTVGVRFQQIQKYECGANRISAARLWQLSEALEVPVGYFYDGLSDVRREIAASEASRGRRDVRPQGDDGPDPRLLPAGRASAPSPAGPGQVAERRRPEHADA